MKNFQTRISNDRSTSSRFSDTTTLVVEIYAVEPLLFLVYRSVLADESQSMRVDWSPLQQGPHMLPRTISFMLVKGIPRIVSCQFYHVAIPRHFRHDGGHLNRFYFFISLHHCLWSQRATTGKKHLCLKVQPSIQQYACSTDENIRVSAA